MPFLWPAAGPEALAGWGSNVYVAAPAGRARCRTIRLVRPWFPSHYRSKDSDVSWFVSCADHPHEGRQGGRAGVPQIRQLADFRRQPWACTGRHDRREPHRHARGTQAPGGDLHGRSEGPGAGHRRNRLEQHGRGDRVYHPRQAGRGRCGACCRSLLQQADAGWPLCPFQGHCRCGRYPDLRLQRAGPHGGQHLGRDAGQAVAGLREHRRHQGRLRRPDAAIPPAPGIGNRLHPALGRGRHGACLQCPWRGRLHLGDGQCCAAPLRAVPGGNPEGRLMPRRCSCRTG